MERNVLIAGFRKNEDSLEIEEDNMIELYLAMAVLCFLGALMIYCVGKIIKALAELRETWNRYKESQEEVLKTLRK